MQTLGLYLCKPECKINSNLVHWPNGARLSSWAEKRSGGRGRGRVADVLVAKGERGKRGGESCFDAFHEWVISLQVGAPAGELEGKGRGGPIIDALRLTSVSPPCVQQVTGLLDRTSVLPTYMQSRNTV